MKIKVKYQQPMKKLTTEEFIKRVREIHGDKYDYSKVKYVNNRTKICIICPIHGEFWQTPSQHLQGRGCIECGKTKQLNNIRENAIEVFLDSAKKIHEGKYIYPNIFENYVKNDKKIPIFCKKCQNIFYQRPREHIHGKNGCPICAGNKHKTQKEFIKDLINVFGKKYDLSKVKYINSKTKVEIVCHNKDKLGREHGSFFANPNKLLDGHGCPKCANQIKDNDLIIYEANQIHHNKYSYEKLNYINKNTKCIVTCPVHGNFEITMDAHINGKQGCPLCNRSKLEIDIEKLLETNNIKYEPQKRFEWMGKQSLDFYLPDYNIAIECQGEQHFNDVLFFNNISLEQRIELDERKFERCKEHNIDILYFTNIKIGEEFLKKHKYYFTVEELIEKINRYEKRDNLQV